MLINRPMSESHNIILKLSVPPIILLKAIDYSGTGSWLDETDNSNNATLENGNIIKLCFMFFWLSITSTWTGLSSVLAFIP